jgi:hypothetical protein
MPAHAWKKPHLGGGIRVEIRADNGNGFHEIGHQVLVSGTTRVIKRYLEAKKGEKYAIVVRNDSPERIGLVIAVDGRNIISGKKSVLANRENMYVLNPFESGRYEGWRTGKDEAHRFYFAEPADSYSIRSFGDKSAMGVIAVAVYREKEKPQPLLEEKRREMAPSAPSSSEGERSAAKGFAREGAGTGFGEAHFSPVINVEFEPERTPVQKTLVKYEWRETLCRKGLLQCGRETGNRLWDDGQYAPCPPDYR